MIEVDVAIGTTANAVVSSSVDGVLSPFGTAGAAGREKMCLCVPTMIDLLP